MSQFLMQAASSVDGALHTWASSSADFAGSGYPGDGTPTDIVVAVRPAEGTGGTVTVADDIAKSAGSDVDRVRGIRGEPIEGSDGPPSVIGATLVYNEVGGGSYKRKQRIGDVYDVTDYGATGDGVTDDTAAVQACMDAAPWGGRIWFPIGVYRLTSNIVVPRDLHLEGAGYTGGTGGSELRFAAGCALVFPHAMMGQAYASPATANHSTCEKLGFQKTAKVTITPWAEGEAVTVGATRIVVASAEKIDAWRHVYLECIKAGTTDADPTDHPTPTEPDVFSAGFVPGATYHLGQMVRGSTDNAEINGTGSNLITNRIFKVTTAGVAGGTHPTWDTDVGDTTTSGSVTFTALDAAPWWSTDGTAVWAHKFDGCLVAFTRVHLTDLWCEGAGGPGVYIRGNASGAVVTNANGWTAYNIRSRLCGVGFMAQGSDAGAGVGTMIDVEGAGHGQPGNGGVGIYDSSGVGNEWVACQVANAADDGGGHSYLTNEGATNATFTKCYAEGWSAGTRNKHIMAHLPSAYVRVDGGTFSCGFSDFIEPARDGGVTEAIVSLDAGQGGFRNYTYRTRIANTVDEVASGSAASIASHGASSNVTELTGLSGLTSSMAGRVVTISGASTADNNGPFIITEVVDPTSCYVINTKDGATGTDANNGALVWSVAGGTVSTFMGARDGNGAVMCWSGPSFTGSNRMVFGYAAVLTGGWPQGWWTKSYNGNANNVACAVADPNAELPSGQAVTDHPFWVPSRLLLGPKTANPIAVDAGTDDPSSLSETKYYPAGSFRWSTAGTGPIGWRCSAAGSPGTWEAVSLGGTVSPGSQNQVYRTTDVGTEWANDDRAVLEDASTGSLDDVATVDGDGNHVGMIAFTAGSHLEISGFAGGYSGRQLVVYCHGTSLDLNDLSTDSTAGNRIDTGGIGTPAVSLTTGQAARLVWRPAIGAEDDGVWQVVSVGAPAGGSGEANTASSAGGTASLVQTKAGVDLPFRGLSATSPVTVTQNTNDVTIALSTVPIASGGTALTAVPGSSGNPIINSTSAYGAATNWSMGTGLTGGASSFVHVASYVSQGTNPATTGGVRLPNNSGIYARNAGNTTDLLLCYVSSADNQVYGGTAAAYGDTIFNTPNVQRFVIQDASVYRLVATSTEIQHGVPIAGSELQSVPMKMKAVQVDCSAGGTITLTAAQYSCPKIYLTGTPASAFDVVFPSQDEGMWHVTNDSGENATLKKSGGTGVVLTPVPDEPNYRRWVDFNSSKDDIDFMEWTPV